MGGALGNAQSVSNSFPPSHPAMQAARGVVQAFVQAVHNHDGATLAQFLRLTNNAQVVGQLSQMVNLDHVSTSAPFCWVARHSPPDLAALASANGARSMGYCV